MRGVPIKAVGKDRAAERLRQQGYADALAGKERQSMEKAYLVGYRGGLKRREAAG